MCKRTDTQHDVLTLTSGYDRTKHPATAQYRYMRPEEARNLRPGQRVAFLDNACKARELTINGAPKTWKRDPARLEIPVKYGMWEYDTFEADGRRVGNGMAWLLVRLGGGDSGNPEPGTVEPATAPADLTPAERFMWEHAGWSYDPKRETSEEGRVRCARELAAAEQALKDAGWEYEVVNDPFEYPGNAPRDVGPWSGIVLRDGGVLRYEFALWGIDTPSAEGDYGRTVAAGLALEAMAAGALGGKSGPVVDSEQAGDSEPEISSRNAPDTKLNRTGRALFLAAGLLLSGTLGATESTHRSGGQGPDVARAERERPVLTITVRVYADGPRFKGASEVRGIPGGKMVLRTVDEDSCTVWVNRDDVELQREAFRACQDAAATATGKAKDGAKGGRQ